MTSKQQEISFTREQLGEIVKRNLDKVHSHYGGVLANREIELAKAQISFDELSLMFNSLKEEFAAVSEELDYMRKITSHEAAPAKEVDDKFKELAEKIVDKKTKNISEPRRKDEAWED